MNTTITYIFQFYKKSYHYAVQENKRGTVYSRI